MLEHFFHSEVFTITFVIGLYLINIKIHRWVQVPGTALAAAPRAW